MKKAISNEEMAKYVSYLFKTVRIPQNTNGTISPLVKQAKKEKITLQIGNNKALIFEADPGNEADQDFAKLCKEVATPQPQSIQDFFTRLNNLQQQQSPATGRKTGRKM